MANNQNSVEMHGIEENLKRLAMEHKKAMRKALKKGAEMIARKLEDNTPYDAKSGNAKHLKDVVVVTNMNQDGEIKVGFGGGESWRVSFVELGTLKQPPQAFIQQTQAQTEQEFWNIVRRELEKELL